jgi:hypothetical protein
MKHLLGLVCMATSMLFSSGCVGGKDSTHANSSPEARYAAIREPALTNQTAQLKAASRITPEEALLKGMRVVGNYADFYGTNWSIRFQRRDRGGWFMNAVVPGEVGIRVLWVTIDDDGRTQVDNAF